MECYCVHSENRIGAKRTQLTLNKQYSGHSAARADKMECYCVHSENRIGAKRTWTSSSPCISIPG